MYQVKEVSSIGQKNKMSVYVTDDMKEYLNSQAMELGISTNAFMVLVFNQYKQQSDALKSANNVQALLTSLSEGFEDIRLRLDNMGK